MCYPSMINTAVIHSEQISISNEAWWKRETGYYTRSLCEPICHIRHVSSRHFTPTSVFPFLVPTPCSLTLSRGVGGGSHISQPRSVGERAGGHDNCISPPVYQWPRSVCLTPSEACTIIINLRRAGYNSPWIIAPWVITPPPYTPTVKVKKRITLKDITHTACCSPARICRSGRIWPFVLQLHSCDQSIKAQTYQPVMET